MIPYPYKFVDFKGVDLSEISGKVVDGIYNAIIMALNKCGEVVLYNWSFASIPIAPSYCSIELRSDSLFINGIIEVGDDDTVWVESLIPPQPDPPVLVQLTVTENGQYIPSDYNADGFSSVSVQVEGQQLRRQAVKVWTNTTGATDASINIQEGIIDGYSFIPTGEIVTVGYKQTPREFSLISIGYGTGYWRIIAKTPISYSLVGTLNTGEFVSFSYTASVTYILYKEE